jgi:hypothetical protein
MVIAGLCNHYMGINRKDSSTISYFFNAFSPLFLTHSLSIINTNYM